MLLIGNALAAPFLRGLKSVSPRLRVEAQKEGTSITTLVYLEDLNFDHTDLALLNATVSAVGKLKAI